MGSLLELLELIDSLEHLLAPSPFTNALAADLGVDAADLGDTYAAAISTAFASAIAGQAGSAFDLPSIDDLQAGGE